MGDYASPYPAGWKNYPSDQTPINEVALQMVDDGVANAVGKTPSSVAGNRVQPTADIPALTLKGKTSQTSALLSLVDSGDDEGFRIKVAADIATPSGGGAVETARVEFPYTGTGHGPNTISSNVRDFSGTSDPILNLGYNSAGDGGAVLAGEPVFRFQIEGDYNDGTRRLGEIFTEAYTPDGLSFFRPFYHAFERTSNSKQVFVRETNLGGNPIQFYIPRNSGNILAAFINYQTPGTRLTLGGGDGGAQLFLTPAPGAFASVLDLGYSSTPAVLQWSTDSTTAARLQVRGVLAAGYFKLAGGVAMSVGGYDNVAGLTVINGTGDVTLPALIGRGAALQTGPLLLLQDSASATKFSVTAAGVVALIDQASDPSTPSSGALLYAKAGATYIRGSGGTVTKVASA